MESLFRRAAKKIEYGVMHIIPDLSLNPVARRMKHAHDALELGNRTLTEVEDIEKHAGKWAEEAGQTNDFLALQEAVAKSKKELVRAMEGIPLIIKGLEKESATGKPFDLLLNKAKLDMTARCHLRSVDGTFRNNETLKEVATDFLIKAVQKIRTGEERQFAIEKLRALGRGRTRAYAQRTIAHLNNQKAPYKLFTP